MPERQTGLGRRSRAAAGRPCRAVPCLQRRRGGPCGRARSRHRGGENRGRGRVESFLRRHGPSRLRPRRHADGGAVQSLGARRDGGARCARAGYSKELGRRGRLRALGQRHARLRTGERRGGIRFRRRVGRPNGQGHRTRRARSHREPARPEAFARRQAAAARDGPRKRRGPLELRSERPAADPARVAERQPLSGLEPGRQAGRVPRARNEHRDGQSRRTAASARRGRCARSWRRRRSGRPPGS